MLSGTKFWLLNLHANIIFGAYNKRKTKNFGFIKNIFKKFAFKKDFSSENWIKNFENFNFCKFLKIKQYFSIPNTNLEWFQLSCDVFIVQIGQKLQSFKNFRPESWKFCFVKCGYFCHPFWKFFESQYGFESFYWMMKLPNAI